MTIKDKLIVYIYNKQNKLENESTELREMLRLDDLDIYEIMRHRTRLQAWNEFVDELYRIVLYLWFYWPLTGWVGGIFIEFWIRQNVCFV